MSKNSNEVPDCHLPVYVSYKDYVNFVYLYILFPKKSLGVDVLLF